nr:hypothetical protein StreXyl84_33890 [Streptomyces sp. Xyl84]
MLATLSRWRPRVQIPSGPQSKARIRQRKRAFFMPTHRNRPPKPAKPPPEHPHTGRARGGSRRRTQQIPSGPQSKARIRQRKRAFFMPAHRDRPPKPARPPPEHPHTGRARGGSRRRTQQIPSGPQLKARIRQRKRAFPIPAPGRSARTRTSPGLTPASPTEADQALARARAPRPRPRPLVCPSLRPLPVP